MSDNISNPSGQLDLPSTQLDLPSAQLDLPSAQLDLPSAQPELPSAPQSGLPAIVEDFLLNRVHDVKDVSELEDSSCPICYESYAESKYRFVRIDACGHVIGFDCLFNHICMGDAGDKCPFCRAKLFELEVEDEDEELPEELTQEGYIDQLNQLFVIVYDAMKEAKVFRDESRANLRDYQLYIRPGLYRSIEDCVEVANWICSLMRGDVDICIEVVEATDAIAKACAKVLEEWSSTSLLSENAARSVTMRAELQALKDAWVELCKARSKIMTNL